MSYSLFGRPMRSKWFTIHRKNEQICVRTPWCCSLCAEPFKMCNVSTKNSPPSRNYSPFQSPCTRTGLLQNEVSTKKAKTFPGRVIQKTDGSKPRKRARVCTVFVSAWTRFSSERYRFSCPCVQDIEVQQEDLRVSRFTAGKVFLTPPTKWEIFVAISFALSVFATFFWSLCGFYYLGSPLYKQYKEHGTIIGGMSHPGCWRKKSYPLEARGKRSDTWMKSVA